MTTQKPITIKDIAEKLKISVSTVSRALKDNHEISAKTRKKVQDLAKQLGYKPNPLAVALKTHKSHTIREHVLRDSGKDNRRSRRWLRLQCFSYFLEREFREREEKRGHTISKPG